jgi:hypothetical protein
MKTAMSNVRRLDWPLKPITLELGSAYKRATIGDIWNEHFVRKQFLSLKVR